MFIIIGESDSDYAKCLVTRNSVSGFATFLEESPVKVKRAIQKVVALSVTEAQIISAFCCEKDMIHNMIILNLLGLLVELIMTLRV